MRRVRFFLFAYTYKMMKALIRFGFCVSSLVPFCVDILAQESVLAPGEKPVMLQEHGAGEGPAWHPELGLLTSGDGHIYRRDLDGKVSIYRENAGTNGLL